eukprot:jgi/Chlat1/5879/Chrsp4S06390
MALAAAATRGLPAALTDGERVGQLATASGRRCVVRRGGRQQHQAGGYSTLHCRASTRSGSSSQASTSSSSSSNAGGGVLSRFYLNVTGFPFPLGPFAVRRTIRYEIKRGEIWTFEQEQGLGFSSVTANTRMTVIKLKSGGLWVHAPIAPTAECIQLLKELDAPVEYIVLPTFAYEHKIFVAPFSRKFPKAKIYIPPGLWSWPINLPPAFFGIFGAGSLEDAAGAPWAGEIDTKLFRPPAVGIGPYIETAFFHKSSKTLLVTDAVVLVPEQAPEVIRPSALIDAAKDGLAVRILSGGKTTTGGPKTVTDTPQNRRLGWQRMVLQILYFGPSDLLDPQRSFQAVCNKLIVSPVVRTLVFDKVPGEVCDWVDSICRDWQFKQIIPCHLTAPIPASPRSFKAAFARYYDLASVGGRQKANTSFALPFFSRKPSDSDFPAQDLQTLSSLDELLVSLGAVERTSLLK